MNPYLFWAILCLALAALIFLMELLLPSGGLLGFIATSALVAGVVLLFKIDTTAGIIGAVVALIGLPVFAILAIRLWPHTPVFRWLVLKSPQRADGNTEEASLVEAVGTALTELRPVGTCLIAGKRYDCISEEGVIVSGTRVRVVSADPFQIKVRREDTNGGVEL
jgi:membrane-bound ClpP family serine protease